MQMLMDCGDCEGGKLYISMLAVVLGVVGEKDVKEEVVWLWRSCLD